MMYFKAIHHPFFIALISPMVRHIGIVRQFCAILRSNVHILAVQRTRSGSLLRSYKCTFLLPILLSIIRTNSRIAHLASGVCNLAYPPSVDYIIGQIFTSHFILTFPTRIAGSGKDYIKNEQRNCHEYQNPGDSEHRIGSQYHISAPPCNLLPAFGCGTAYLIPGITDEGKHGYAHQPADYRLTVRTPELRQYGNHTQHSTYPVIAIRLRHNVHSGTSHGDAWGRNCSIS